MNRRSRVSRGQSKFGCFTCKARKVKCDETKPACLRCQRAHRVCEGYPERAGIPVDSPSNVESPPHLQLDPSEHLSTYSTHQESTSYATSSPASSAPGSPMVPHDLGFSDEERRHIKLALRIVFRSQVDDFQYAYEPLKERLFQFDVLCPSTKAAATAVGAVADQLTQLGLARTRSKSAKSQMHYIRALRILRQDINVEQDQPSSLLLSTILCMSVELMMCRRHNALKHLCGASQVLNATATSIAATKYPDGDIQLAHRAIDILRLSYSDCTKRNTINPVPHGVPRDVSQISNNMELFDKHVLETVHAGFCFITTTALAICRSEPLEDLHVDQRQHLLEINQCLTTISTLLDQGEPSTQAHIYRLQCMCLSIFIEISTLFAESESAWDEYAQQFEQIVRAAEAVLEARSNTRSRLPPHLPIFSLQSGIVQPLYLVALKYRHRTWRRKAIMHLHDAGQDGPWKGPTLARVALWCTQVEEANDRVSRPPDETFHYQAANMSSISPEPEAVPERNRIAVCRLLEDAIALAPDGTDTPEPHCPPYVTVKLLRRRKAVGAIPARVLSPVGVGSVIESEHLTLTRLDDGDWEQWTEAIPL